MASDALRRAVNGEQVIRRIPVLVLIVGAVALGAAVSCNRPSQGNQGESAPASPLQGNVVSSQFTEQRSARVGEPFTIRLQALTTAGFEWQPGFDPQTIELVDRRVEAPAGGVGGAGEEVLTFKALRSGRATITLDLRRSWEKDARESRVYEISVES